MKKSLKTLQKDLNINFEPKYFIVVKTCKNIKGLLFFDYGDDLYKKGTVLVKTDSFLYTRTGSSLKYLEYDLDSGQNFETGIKISRANLRKLIQDNIIQVIDSRETWMQNY